MTESIRYVCYFIITILAWLYLVVLNGQWSVSWGKGGGVKIKMLATLMVFGLALILFDRYIPSTTGGGGADAV